MVRAQIYLTEAEKNQLHVLARYVGKSQSELIREAIDQFLERNLDLKNDKLSAVLAVKGMWAKSSEINFADLRQEWDRQHGSK